MPERKLVLRHCGKIDPEDISTYLASGGFQGLKRARDEMSPAEVVEEVKASGLRGRGGAGFSCGVKWEMVATSESPEKFFICNADEGEVGTFKDRIMLEKDAFSLMEGILIACYALGVGHAFLYLREEYSFLAGRLQKAIDQATREGFCDGTVIEMVEGAGAYVCGEESALMESIEGKRGEPRYRPPFPTDQGLFGKPTVVNNVETLMNIPWIITHGAGAFKQIGVEKNSGTKVFCVIGDVERPGVYELALGSTVEELVLEHAGARDVRMVQVGGGGG
ncbi:MAG: SLBB domain-containing protein, partial [Deltaproteobacteria bacterium]|nr:SLBB domain-containing protein [Deltaproteobacteria bacterium]